MVIQFSPAFPCYSLPTSGCLYLRFFIHISRFLSESDAQDKSQSQVPFIRVLALTVSPSLPRNLFLTLNFHRVVRALPSQLRVFLTVHDH